MLTFDDARRIAAEYTGEPIEPWGWADADAFVVVPARGVGDPTSVGEQTMSVNRRTGQFEWIFTIAALDRINRMRPVGARRRG